jgi:D-glycero-alpha-D-manno-heptose-7-phosphate kinase
MEPPLKVINSVAPVRICDIGGWTDTWFAGHGQILNIAVYPYAEVQCMVFGRSARTDRIVIHAENYGLRYGVAELDAAYDKLPLVEAALRRLPVPQEAAVELAIYCQVPPGASTGTSAAVSVAIIGALARLARRQLSVYEVVRLAHQIEVEDLELQSGIQDQLCSAYGGINFIQMSAYPHASVSSVVLPQALWWEVEHRLLLAYVGKPHQSSRIHEEVIRGLGANAAQDARLERLRELAGAAKCALLAGDLREFGRIMDANTEAQRALHPALICPAFEEVMRIARGLGAWGCKVNGAGGDGGSLTVLTDGDGARKRKLMAALEAAGISVLPIYLARQGLRVWEGQPGAA